MLKEGHAMSSTRVALEAVVVGFKWKSDDPSNEWCIAEVDDGSSLLIVKGVLPSAQKGKAYQIEGFVREDAFGSHIQAQQAVPIIPKSKAAIEAFLRTLPHIGHTSAKALVREFGEKAIEALQKGDIEAIKKAGVRGLNADRIKTIRLVLEEWTADSELALGIGSLITPIRTDKRVKSISDQWGSEAIDVIKSDPWRLTEIAGIGFTLADQVGLFQGFADTSPERISAGIVHTAQQLRQNGHTCFVRAMLVSDAARLLGLSSLGVDAYAPLIDARVDKGISEGLFVNLPTGEIQLKKDRDDEVYIAKKIDERLELRLGEFVQAQPPEGIEKGLMGDQVTALRGLLNHGTAIVTGAPGTGKTFSVKAMLSCFALGDFKLCAPTGKAARRLAESTGIKARTIHSLLGAMVRTEKGKKVFGFEHNEANPFEHRVIVVDEFSMVDTHLFTCLLKAMPADCRLILVGDPNQLPSVGPGALLRDLIASKRVPVFELTEIKRTNPGRLLTQIHEVKDGIWTEIKNRQDSDLFYMHQPQQDEIPALIVSLYMKRLREMDFVKEGVRDIQILLPWKTKSSCSVENLNKLIQNARAQAGEVELHRFKFGEGDKVLQTKNDPNLGVVNGDIGVINKITNVINDENGNPKQHKNSFYMVFFEGYPEVVPIPCGANNLELAYALTIHKSQGSEWPCVILAATGTTSPFYSRSLLYTALSRAKSAAVVVGNQSNMDQVAGRSSNQNRRTGIGKLLLI